MVVCLMAPESVITGCVDPLVPLIHALAGFGRQLDNLYGWINAAGKLNTALHIEIQMGQQIDLVDREGRTLTDPYVVANPMFVDWEDYSNPLRPATGRLTPHYGILFQVADQSENGDTVTINVSKIW